MGESSRSVEVIAAGDDEPAELRLRFYDGRIDVGVDSQHRFIGAELTPPLDADSPLYVPGEGTHVSSFTLEGAPVKLLRDKAERIIGVHVFDSWRISGG